VLTNVCALRANVDRAKIDSNTFFIIICLINLTKVQKIWVIGWILT